MEVNNNANKFDRTEEELDVFIKKREQQLNEEYEKSMSYKKDTLLKKSFTSEVCFCNNGTYLGKFISFKRNYYDVARECDILKKIGSHQNIEEFVDYYANNDNFVIVTKITELRNFCFLSDLDPKHIWSEQIIKKILKDLLSGLYHLHKLNIVHNNITLNNIGYSWSNQIATITNFESSFVNDSDKCDYPNKVITYDDVVYMSPEEIEYNKVNEKTDIWCLGVLVYKLVYGEFPFSYYSKDDEIVDKCYKHETNSIKKTDAFKNSESGQLFLKNKIMKNEPNIYSIDDLSNNVLSTLWLRPGCGVTLIPPPGYGEEFNMEIDVGNQFMSLLKKMLNKNYRIRISSNVAMNDSFFYTK